MGVWGGTGGWREGKRGWGGEKRGFEEVLSWGSVGVDMEVLKGVVVEDQKGVGMEDQKGVGMEDQKGVGMEDQWVSPWRSGGV